MGVIAVLGPTASGKSGLAMALAAELGGEIVSVDSMQVYRGLDIGTAKASAEDQAAVPHHLIDVADPEETFTAAEHQRLGIPAIDQIKERGKLPLIVGGSGLHFRAVVDPLDFPPSDPDVQSEIQAMTPGDAVLALLAIDPEVARYVDLANSRRVSRALEIHRITGVTPTERSSSAMATAVREYRPRIPLLAIGLDPGDSLPERVESRFDAMLDNGLLDEVRNLEPRLGVTARQGVGYKELLPVVAGEIAIEEGRAAAIRASMALAKRQRTFFRRDPRIRWIPWHDESGRMLEEALTTARETIQEAAWTS